MIVMAYYQEYDYRIPSSTGIWILLCGIFLNIPMLILTPKNLSHSTQTFGIMIAIFAILFGIFLIKKSKEPSKKVIVTDNAISFPKIPLSNTLTTIDFDEIKKLKMIYNPSIKNALKIVGNHQKGELLGYCFNDPNTLKEIKEYIESYLNQ